MNPSQNDKSPRKLTRVSLTVLLVGLWINLSEFLRNEILLKSLWESHYQSLGLAFPSAPVNGMVWVAWGFLFAATLYLASRRLSALQATLLCWLITFPLMWLVLWNLHVLPEGLLTYAAPLSAFEVWLGILICRTLAPPEA